MPRIRSLWAAALLACVLAWPTTAALAAHLAPATPQQPQYIECTSITEMDDNLVTNGGHNPFVDDLGNTWRVYYDLQSDSRDFTPCSMRVVMRIYNPAPDGSWSGTASVFADVNGSYNSYSWGQVSASSTYQHHLVWRGPWFGADSGSYVLKIDEYNGSKAYTQAYTTFSL